MRWLGVLVLSALLRMFRITVRRLTWSLNRFKQVARHAGFREVSRGANVQIFDAYDDGVFHGKGEDRGNMDSPSCSALHRSQADESSWGRIRRIPT